MQRNPIKENRKADVTGKTFRSVRLSGMRRYMDCGGIWIADKDLEKISEYPSVCSETADQSEAQPDFDSVAGLCPNGHGLMTRAKVDLEPHFYLNKCTSCAGIWFDRGELDRIVENNLTENLSVLWSFSWQRMVKKNKGIKYYRSVNKKLLGEDVYNAILELAEKIREHPDQLRALALLHHELKKTD